MRPSLPPLVLVRTVATRQVVTAASDGAAAHGIRPGMTLAQARALCAGVEHADHDPAADVRGLEALSRYLQRFSPVVMPVGDRGDEDDLPRDHGIYLDLTGCGRVFDGLDSLVSQLAATLARFGLCSRLAVADNPAAAWALTYAATPAAPLVLTKEGYEHLADLPIVGLRLPDELLTSLEHLGLETIGQVLALPRASLPARFGPNLTRRLNQLLGREPEPLVPLPYHAPVEAGTEFDGPAPSTEPLLVAFDSLLPGLIEQLARRGQGARRIDLQILRAYAPTVVRTLHLARPTRNARTITNLFRCVLETLGKDEGGGRRGTRPQRYVASDPSAGFLGLRVTVPDPEPVTDEQVDAFDAAQQTDGRAFDDLLVRLRLRLGDDVLVRPVLVESHLPEKAWRGGGSDERTTPAATRVTDAPSRPLHLLARPEEVGVMVSPSHDRDGRPIALRWGRSHYAVTHHTGPERIGGLWWAGHGRTRDYFEVETTEGLRFWLFRVLETSKWYLHGLFE